jgi:hypothetical protein
MVAGDRAPRCGARCSAEGRRSSGRQRGVRGRVGEGWRRTGSPAVALRADMSCVEGTIPEPLDRPESSLAGAADASGKFLPPENRPGRPFRGVSEGTSRPPVRPPGWSATGVDERSYRRELPERRRHRRCNPVPFASRLLPLDLRIRAAASAIRWSEATRVAPAGETVVPLRGPCIESRPPAMDAMPGTPPDRAPCSTHSGRTGRAKSQAPVARQAAGTRGGWDSAVGWCKTELPPARVPRGMPGEPASLNTHREL